MASFPRLVSFIVVVSNLSFLFVECKTPTDDRSRRFGVPNYSPPNYLCLRRCKENAKQREKHKISLEQCIKDCEQGNILNVQRKQQRGHVPVIVRVMRSADENASTNCQGFPGTHYPPAMPRTIENVACKEYSSKEHHYNVSWKPVFDKFEEKPYTHYSLLYKFATDNEESSHMECRLISKNLTYLVLKHNLSSPYSVPDILLVAVVPYPFSKDYSGTIPLYSACPITLPTFIPRLVQTKAPVSSFKIEISVVGGFVALLIILLMVLVWRRSRRRQTQYREAAIPCNPLSRENANPNNHEAAIPGNPLSPENASPNNELFHCCYYPESDTFRCNVASIVNRFRSDGFNVIMDSMVSNQISSQGPMRWAETQIRKASKVLVFLSPGLLKIANETHEVHSQYVQEIGRVWFELDLLRDLYGRTHSAFKIVCITISNTPVNTRHSLPLWAKVIYKFPEDYNRILQRLNERPSIQPLSL